jgi:hypothetical protein
LEEIGTRYALTAPTLAFANYRPRRGKRARLRRETHTPGHRQPPRSGRRAGAISPARLQIPRRTARGARSAAGGQTSSTSGALSPGPQVLVRTMSTSCPAPWAISAGETPMRRFKSLLPGMTITRSIGWCVRSVGRRALGRSGEARLRLPRRSFGRLGLLRSPSSRGRARAGARPANARAAGTVESAPSRSGACSPRCSSRRSRE